MIALIDYGVGNLFSLKSSFDFIGEKVIVTGDAKKIRSCDKIVLPGVGAFRDAAGKLKASGLDTLIKNEAACGKPILGICLGMQMLFEKSYEYGEYEGLGLIGGKVVPFEGRINKELKIPHIGWNALIFPKNKEKNPLFKYVSEGEHVYFVHSYFADECEGDMIAKAEYDILFCAAAARKNVYGTQFHPEKSGETGLNILRAFCEL